MIENPYFRGMLNCESHHSRDEDKTSFGPFTLNANPVEPFETRTLNQHKFYVIACADKQSAIDYCSQIPNEEWKHPVYARWVEWKRKHTNTKFKMRYKT